MKDLLSDQSPKLTSLAVNQTTDDELMISVNRLNLLVELYHYYPILRKKDRNLSTELYFVMSSNKKGTAYDKNIESKSSS